jgi:hypothetical protein
MTAALEQFLVEMQSRELIFSGLLIADGTLRRFKAGGDDHRDSRYVLHDGPAFAAFGGVTRNFTNVCERHEHTSSSLPQNKLAQYSLPNIAQYS